MNRVILIGRLVADPEIKYSQGSEPLCIARYRLAVDRRFKKQGNETADFISCVAFGKQGEFAEKYLHKGMKIAVTGRIQTGSYTKQDGTKVYTTDVVAEDHEFVESKSESKPQEKPQEQPKADDGFMSLPDDFAGLPFA